MSPIPTLRDKLCCPGEVQVSRATVSPGKNGRGTQESFCSKTLMEEDPKGGKAPSFIPLREVGEACLYLIGCSLVV